MGAGGTKKPPHEVTVKVKWDNYAKLLVQGLEFSFGFFLSFFILNKNLKKCFLFKKFYLFMRIENEQGKGWRRREKQTPCQARSLTRGSMPGPRVT